MHKEDQTIWEIFYASHCERLVAAIKSEKVAHKIQLVLDLLATCATHKNIALTNFPRQQVIPAALAHLGSRDKVSVLGVIKFIRELVREEVFQGLVIKDKLLYKL